MAAGGPVSTAFGAAKWLALGAAGIALVGVFAAPAGAALSTTMAHGAVATGNGIASASSAFSGAVGTLSTNLGAIAPPPPPGGVLGVPGGP